MATLSHRTLGSSYLTSWLRRRRTFQVINTHGHKPSTSRYASTMARTYESALSHLAALQSNRAITSLFTPPPPPPTTLPSSEAASVSPAAPKQDLNALAIPEMIAWLQRAGISQDRLAADLRCIHVAGTKGKGSVCAYLTALLAHGDDETRRVAGKVGTYTSPHLVSVRERIAIDGAPISRALFARYFFQVWDACTEAARDELAATQRRVEEKEKGLPRDDDAKGSGGSEVITEEELQGPATKPFYFRFLTIVALRAFLGEGVRSAVIECGIGGEYDSTNVLPRASVTASVVTQLGIDHVGMLGRTLPEIAWHKAGVCKSSRKCFTRRLEGKVMKGDTDTDTAAVAVAEKTMQVLRQRAAEKGATLVEIEDTDVEKWGGIKANEKGAGSLEGEFQKYNQTLAVAAAREHLRVLASEENNNSNSSVSGREREDPKTQPPEKLEDVPPSFAAALQYARLRGRCETREDESAPVTWLIDGAHTAESLTEVARWFSSKIDHGSDKSKANTILLFNQQERDAAQLVSGFLADIEALAPTGDSSGSAFEFTHAIFSRNDLKPRDLSPSSNSNVEAAAEPERDLSMQNAAAAALHSSSPATSTRVLDNIADAVAEARALAKRNSNGERTMVLVTGSLHLIGALLRTLEPDAED